MSSIFHKYEGLGNDFVLVEADRDDAVSTDRARELCDRRFGVGADGILLILPPRSPHASARMRVLNADGSIPEMCGNGLRCAVVHVARMQARDVGELTFETDAGLRTCRFEQQRGQGEVVVDMGVVRIVGERELDVGLGAPWTFTLADAGNPHAVTTHPASREAIDVVGPRVSTDAHFPAGTNVEFATFRSSSVDLTVWERGVGITLACGTGACSAVVVGVAKGLLPRKEPIRVSLPGGSLFVTVEDDDRVLMKGPARHVFSGELAQ